MHSQVATNLENLKLLEYYKYSDSNGVERDLTLATWNGKDVIITDDGTVDSTGEKYTTYILGKGAIKYAELGVKVPYEMARDAKTNGGETSLITRRRLTFSPVGISYVSNKTISPTKEELKRVKIGK